jgi:predicted RNase H-like HicB family nuclease
VGGQGFLKRPPPWSVRSFTRASYNILINVLMPGAGGTTATCRECPELLELGDDPDDALRRMREAIEQRAGHAHDVTGEWQHKVTRVTLPQGSAPRRQRSPPRSARARQV